MLCLSDGHLFIKLWATKFRAPVPLGAQVFRALGAGPKKQGVAQVQGVPALIAFRAHAYLLELRGLSLSISLTSPGINEIAL